MLEVDDAFLPENAGRYRVTAGGAERTEAAADLRLDVTGLGSVYLGGFGFGDLVARLARRGADATAPPRAAMRSSAPRIAPWCAEIF